MQFFPQIEPHPKTDNNISRTEEHLSCSDLWRLSTIEQKFNCETTENWHQTKLNAKKRNDNIPNHSKSCRNNCNAIVRKDRNDQNSPLSDQRVRKELWPKLRCCCKSWFIPCYVFGLSFSTWGTLQIKITDKVYLW